MTDLQATRSKFTAALDGLVDQVKRDRSILAAILCGSLSHDIVWEKSDIDLILVTVDDRRLECGDRPVNADGVNVHVMLMPRAAFRKTIEGSLHQSFMHSLLAKGTLLYTHDPTIAQLCERLPEIGTRDTALQLLQAATHALPFVYKAHKFLITRGDLDYTALWILYAATPLATIEVISRKLLADREVIPQAVKLNPEFFNVIYTELLNQSKTRPLVERALEAVDRYLAERARSLFAPILDHLREAGEIRTSRELEHHFTRHLNVSGVVTACEYLADQGLAAKASAAVRLTKAGQVDVQELAFFHLDTGSDRS